MIEIPLTKGCVALVDDRDSHLATFRWHTHENPPGVYARRTIAGRSGRSRIEFMHHAVLGVPSSVQVDHVNGNGLDNRRENLRIASHAQNQANRRLGKNNTSGFKGVYWHRGHGRWRAAIKVSGRKIVLGHFITPEAAARAYDKAALEHFGAYARINFPEMTPEQRHWFEEGRREGIREVVAWMREHDVAMEWEYAAMLRALASRGDVGKEGYEPAYPNGSCNCRSCLTCAFRSFEPGRIGYCGVDDCWLEDTEACAAWAARKDGCK